MPILIACLARQVPTPRDQPRPRNPMSPERYVAIVRSIAVIFRANQPPTRARLAHRPDARAPCPCRLVKQFAGLARSRAPGRPRAADTPRRGLVIYDSHEYYPTHSGRSLSGHLFSIGRGARDARRAYCRRIPPRCFPPPPFHRCRRISRCCIPPPLNPARQSRDPARAPLVATSPLTDPTPAFPTTALPTHHHQTVPRRSGVSRRIANRNAAWPRRVWAWRRVRVSFFSFRRTRARRVASFSEAGADTNATDTNVAGAAVAALPRVRAFFFERRAACAA